MPRGKIFTFLPLPRYSNLPVHINGHFHLSGESRRDLWTDERNSYKNGWNEAILCQIVAPAYCSLLIYMKEREFKSISQNFRKTLSQYYKLFPEHESWKAFKKLTLEVYNYICTQKLDLFLLYNPHSVENMEWTCVDNQVYFDNLDFEIPSFNQKLENPFAKFLRETLHSCGMRIIDGPFELWKKFNEAGLKNIRKISPESVRNYLLSWPLTNCLPQKVEITPFKSVDGVGAVLSYVLSDAPDHSKLLNLPILMDANGSLRKVTSSDPILYESRYRGVAPHKLDHFIHPSIETILNSTIVKNKIIKSLTIFDLAKLLTELQNPSSRLSLVDHEPCFEWLKSVWKFIGDVLKDPRDLKSIENIKMIPALVNGTSYIYPLQKRLCVLQPLDRQNESSLKLFESLGAIGAPRLDTNCFENCDVGKCFGLFGNVHNPGNLLLMLEEVFVNLKSNYSFDKNSSLEILHNFSRNIESLGGVENSVYILKSLPLFIDVNESQISLEDKSVFVIPSSIPPFDTQTLPSSHVFLKEDRFCTRLFTYVGAKILKDSEAYTIFLFDAFPKFSFDSRMKHLETIKIIAERNETNFLKRLQSFEFIDHQGSLKRASYFFEAKEIFILMKENFLPEPFNNTKWRRFLAQCGLVTSLTEEKFLEYAIKLPSSKTNTAKVQSLMIDWLKTSENTLRDTFLSKLKSIPFLSPAEVQECFINIHLVDGSVDYIPFENSVPIKNAKFCWTLSNILPQNTDILSDNLLKKLNVKTELDVNIVLKNLKNLSHGFQEFAKSGRDVGEETEKCIEMLTDAHLSFFEQKQLDPQFFEKLKDVKSLFISCMRTLVRPNQIALDITEKEQIMPFIFKLPCFYGKRVRLLISLGASNYITMEQCAISLEEIKRNIGEIKMDPNMSDIAEKLFSQLMKILENDKTCNIKRLLVPCIRNILCESARIYCTANRDLVRLADSLDRPLRICDNLKLLTILPEYLRPTILDDHMDHKIDSLGKSIEIPIVNNLERNFHDFKFLEGLLRLKLYEIRECKEYDSEMIFDQLESKIYNIKLSGNSEICISSYMNGVVVENSQKKVPHYILHDQQNDFLKIFVSPDHDNSFLLNLSSHLSQYLEMPKARFPLKEILSMDPRLIDKTLDDLEIFHVQYDIKPAVGVEIAIENHFTLVQDVIILYPEQLVAYQVDDPADRDEDGEPKYILVRVVKSEESSKGLSRFEIRYEIDFGNDRKIISATKLYAFEATANDKSIVLMPQSVLSPKAIIKPSTNLKEIILEINDSLREVRNLNENDRKQAIKRMYLKYHPDKNRGEEELYTEAFKQLKNLVEKLENDISFANSDPFSENLSRNDGSARNSRNCGQGFYERMDRRAKSHGYTKKNKNCGGYQQTYHDSPRQAYRRFFNDISQKRRKNPSRALIWLNQARHDTEAANNDLQSTELKSPKWRCIKYYQAARNAIMGVWYSKDAGHLPTIDNTLGNLCSEIYDERLNTAVQVADDILKSMEHLTDPGTFTSITSSMADATSELVERILTRCEELVAMYNDY